MTDKPISLLPPTSTPAPTDEIETNQGGVTRKQTREQLHTLESGEAIDTSSGVPLSLKANEVEGIELAEASSHILVTGEMHTGLTASTVQAQGEGQLLSSFNEVAVCANDNDTVTAPAAVKGRHLEIINNGAKILQVFPLSGDNLGAGVDVRVQIAAGQSVEYIGIDTTDWHIESATEGFNADMQQTQHTTAFVISGQDNDTCHHSAALAAGPLLGWTFDPGGAGTSFPIASIADGAASGVDIAVTTTGSHGLAVGKVISQADLTNPVYEGVFVVKAIISPTIYEVAAVFTATDTGTMDQAATLIASAEAAGDYALSWWASATNETNNQTFDFKVYNGATQVVGIETRRKFGTAGDFGSLSGGGGLSIVAGDVLSFVITNTSGTGNLTVRNFNMEITKD